MEPIKKIKDNLGKHWPFIAGIALVAAIAVFFLVFKKQKISRRLRLGALFVSVVIFGVVLGADPSPMGTVKDAIHLFATAGAVFPPPRDGDSPLWGYQR